MNQEQDRRHTAVLLLRQMMDALDPLTESSKEFEHQENRKLINRAITLTDLLFQRLEESSRPYQIHRPIYAKGEKVILSSFDQQSIQVVKDVYFDYTQHEWLYRFEPNELIIHEFYSESFLSKALDD